MIIAIDPPKVIEMEFSEEVEEGNADIRGGKDLGWWRVFRNWD